MVGSIPPNPREVMGFLVRERQGGRVVHHELMPSSHLSAERLAHRSSKKVEDLERSWRYPEYEVESGIYNTEDAFFRANPDVEA